MSLSYCADQLRKYDYDHYLITLFAPAKLREALFTIFAFYHEINKTHEIASDVQIAQIRIQWWRDKVVEIFEKPPEKFDHPVLESLAKVITHYSLSQENVISCIDACESNLMGEMAKDEVELMASCLQGKLTLWLLIDKVTEHSAEDIGQKALQDIVSFSTCVDLLYNFTDDLQNCHVNFPMNLMEREGLTRNKIELGQASDAIQVIAKELSVIAQNKLDSLNGVASLKRKVGVPAYMQLKMSEQYFQQIKNVEYNLLSSDLKKRPAFQVLRLYFKSIF